MRSARNYIFRKKCIHFRSAYVPLFPVDSFANTDGLGKTMTCMDDAGLETAIERIAVGDKTAFDMLYAATLPRMLALARRILRSESAAEDCAAETYIRIWRDAARFDPRRGSAMAWLYTICRTRALDQLRAGKRRTDMEQTPSESAPAQDIAAADDLTAAIEVSCAIWPCLMRLSQVQRELLRLAFFDGMSHSEIGRATGMPLGSVKSHIHRAVIGLREQLVSVGIPPIQRKSTTHG
jgi:RNA polymerase sigma factor (sigma-70 family)